MMLRLLSFCSVILFVAACTPKEERGMQQITLATQPSIQASCTLQNSAGSWYAITPGDTMVTRTRDPLHIRCDHKDYMGHIQVPPRADAWMLVASTVDGMKGPLYSYPEQIVVPLAARPTQ